MSRALWKGAISFGLVHVPVELYPAEKRNALQFDLLDKRDMQPVGYQRINKKSGKAVPWEQIVKGYEHSKGKYVVLSEADFRKANVEATQTIDILSFVDLDDIPVIHFDTPHYLVPARGGGKGYTLLMETLREAKKAAIAQVVIRTRQRLAAVMPSEGMLVMCTLRYGYEIRSRDEIEAPPQKKTAVSKQEVQMALQLVDEMSAPFQPKKYKDTYREDLMARIRKKVRSGDTEEVAQPEEEEAPPRKSAEVIDLVALLKKSLHGKEGAKPAKRAAAPRRVHRQSSKRAARG
jgi:DNA end-binding protein Ku